MRFAACISGAEYAMTGPCGSTSVSMSADRYVVFSHGKDSGPWGKKITALADVARSEGYEVESVDYRGIDDVTGRIDKLIEVCKSAGRRPGAGRFEPGRLCRGGRGLAAARARRVPDGAGAVPGGPAAAARAAARLSRGRRARLAAMRWCRSSTACASRASTAPRCICWTAIISCTISCSFIKYLFEYFLIGLDLPTERGLPASDHARGAEPGCSRCGCARRCGPRMPPRAWRPQRCRSATCSSSAAASTWRCCRACACASACRVRAAGCWRSGCATARSSSP